MSVSPNGQKEDENASEDAAAPARDLYKQKPVSTVVRVLTVLAYLFSVSLAAILLSVYYVCFWKSSEPVPLNGTAELSARRGDPHEYAETFPVPLNFIGGGHTSVSDIITEPSTSNNATTFTNTTATSIFENNSTFDPTVLSNSTKQESQTINILDENGAFNETDSVT